MKKTIYIAASWKHQHAVEMLTTLLRKDGYEVRSFVENNYGEGHSAEKPMPFEDWMKTPEADKSFEYDTQGAATSDMVIYIGPSGKDASVEVGIAWGRGVPIVGLWAKGEDMGLMRKVMRAWFNNHKDLLDSVNLYFENYEAISMDKIIHKL